ncbi:MAG: hypothetical protein HYV76_00790 [Candidatus Vogelbacteria bacterium]|nr:hypothetical protein [Candidatus Vogelbacteria bacterium]
MDKVVLVVTHRRGFEADPVIDELRRRSISVFRFNTDACNEASVASFTSEGEEVTFSCDGRRVASTNVAVGWCQQLPPYLGQAGDERACLQRENLLALQLPSLDALKIPWFNKPWHVLHASSKIAQLVVARAIGLTIPKTLVSNDPHAIRNFAQEQTTVAKNLATPWVVSCGETHAAYTRIVDLLWLLDDAALSFAPIIYQEYRERKRDIRVVVVGDATFAASCVPGPHQREDVRKESGAGESFEACNVDAETTHKLHSLMRMLQLDYCAADFMEDTDGNLFFLEVNTCGAWWWLDQFYNGAICRALADALVSRMGGSA